MKPNSPFSERETEVVKYLMQGCSNKQIAQALGIKIRTVEFHLGNIYSKLNVTSRAEAILKLSENNRNLTVDNHSQVFVEPQTAEPWESTVEKSGESVQNSINTSTQRRPLMRRSIQRIPFLVLTGILFCVLFLLVWNFQPSDSSINKTENAAVEVTDSNPATLPVATQPATATLTAQESNNAEIMQLVAEYNQAVQKELETGNYQTSIDPKSGENLILFQGDSKERLLFLFDELNENMRDLLQQYKALYIAEVQPTPFPTRTNEEETEAYFHRLEAQYSAFFDQILVDGPTVPVFDPVEGKYVQRVIGDAYARSEIMVDAMGALQSAPLVARVDQSADIELIRKVMDSPDLQLTFLQISSLANAPGIYAAIYSDDQGARYSVAIDARILVSIEPSIRPDVPALEVKSIEEVCVLAQEFAINNSPLFSEMKDGLSFDESSKGDIYFYTWHIQGIDWSETDWHMMPPFLQIGMAADGKLVSYIDTLDLYSEN